MFFIMGIYEKAKEICTTKSMHICPECGRYCTYRIYTVYMCLSLFFIPVLKWNKKYYTQTSCCRNIKEIDKETANLYEKEEK